MHYEKVYVGVILYVGTDGVSKSVEIEWEGARRFRINKIYEKRFAPPRHVGSTPTLRYTVLVEGRERELYFEKYSNKWFVERLVD